MNEWFTIGELVVCAALVRGFNPALWPARAWPWLVAYMWGCRILMALYGAGAAIGGDMAGAGAAVVLLWLGGRVGDDEREHEPEHGREREDGGGGPGGAPYKPRPFR